MNFFFCLTFPLTPTLSRIALIHFFL